MKKYALCMFLDISNAFNNLWWPAIIDSLKRMRCSVQIVRIMGDYLNRRRIMFRTESGTIDREVNKGCPQGSILGPILWNIVFNELLAEYELLGIRIVAFADDLVIVIGGDSRRQLEERGQKALKMAEEWCIKFKMKLSQKKTEMMLAKGKLSISRPPRINLAGTQVGFVEEFKYLGLTIQHGVKGLKAGKHLEYISKKSKTMFSALKRVAKRE